MKQKTATTAQVKDQQAEAQPRYTFGQDVPFEEDATHELKRCSDITAARNFIRDGCVIKTVVGFLNSPRGGTLYLGIDDEGTVWGSRLTRAKRDKFRLAMATMLKTITPSVLPSLVTVEFVQVAGEPHKAKPHPPKGPHSTQRGAAVASLTTDDDAHTTSQQETPSPSAEGATDAASTDAHAEAVLANGVPPMYREWRASRRTDETNEQKRAEYLRLYGHLLPQSKKSQKKSQKPNEPNAAGIPAAPQPLAESEPEAVPLSNSGDVDIAAGLPAVPQPLVGSEPETTPLSNDVTGEAPTSPPGDEQPSADVHGASEEIENPLQATPKQRKKGACFRCGRSGHRSETCVATVHVSGEALDPATAGIRPSEARPAQMVVEITVRAGLSRVQPVPYETREHHA